MNWHYYSFDEIRGKITVFDTSRDFDVSLAIFRFIVHISEKLHQAGLRINQDNRKQIS